MTFLCTGPHKFAHSFKGRAQRMYFTLSFSIASLLSTAIFNRYKPTHEHRTLCATLIILLYYYTLILNHTTTEVKQYVIRLRFAAAPFVLPTRSPSDQIPNPIFPLKALLVRSSAANIYIYTLLIYCISRLCFCVVGL